VAGFFPELLAKAKAVLLGLSDYSFEFEHYDVGMNYTLWAVPALEAYDILYQEWTASERSRLESFGTFSGQPVHENADKLSIILFGDGHLWLPDCEARAAPLAGSAWECFVHDAKRFQVDVRTDGGADWFQCGFPLADTPTPKTIPMRWVVRKGKEAWFLAVYRMVSEVQPRSAAPSRRCRTRRLKSAYGWETDARNTCSRRFSLSRSRATPSPIIVPSPAGLGTMG